jgi:phosphoglycerol geranylgeranyltransferase
LGPTETKLLSVRKASGTLIAALIDPEEFTPDQAGDVARKVESLGAGCIFLGGSTIADQAHLDAVVRLIKRDVTIPVILFPGNITGISSHADAILFSSLLNSTNNYFIIGAQAIGSIQVMKSKLEAIPMGYLVFGDQSTTGFVGQVRAIPLDKPSIAVMYAMAAWYLGMRSLYLEAGSGSNKTVSPEVIKAVRKYYPGILIVGGGVTSPQVAARMAGAGADLIVIGNLLQSKGFESKLGAIVRAAKDKAHLSHPT